MQLAEILAVLALAIAPLMASEHPLIFPPPQELRALEGRFRLTPDSVIAVPLKASDSDLRLARMLREELSDRWSTTVGIQRLAALPAGKRVVLMGELSNPLIRAYCAKNAPEMLRNKPSGYTLEVTDKLVLVAGTDETGAFYGLQSLRQLIGRHDTGLGIQTLQVRDWPDKPFRGIRLFLPGRNNIPFFKRFVRDFMALYKFNKLIIEVNACMRLEGHPELNRGWVEFGRDVNYSRRNYPSGPPHEWEQNSSHQDAGDGGFLEKEEVSELVAWARKYYLEVIPELPSLSHSFYLLTKHTELSEVPDERWPDTYCPSNPASRQLLFEVLDEYLDVIKPSMVHIGHDETFAPLDSCLRCKDKDKRELFAQDVIAIHDHLAKRGVGTAMWGDMLLEAVRGKGPQDRVAPDGFKYQISGALTPEMAARLPHDILVFNWFWQGPDARANEEHLERFGFKQIYGNLAPQIEDYPERGRRETLVGGVSSAWEQTTETLFGKDLILNFLGSESLLWSNQALGNGLPAIVQALLPEIRERLRGAVLPSETGDLVMPIDISSRFNLPKDGKDPIFATFQALVDNLHQIRSGAIVVGSQGTEPNPLPHEVDGIPVGCDATSLIFLHACARPATNKSAYRTIWNMEDTADLLGWYEVVYEDGFVLTIPIRFGVNILHWNWQSSETPGLYCYACDPAPVGPGNGSPVTFFTHEWINPRLGKVISEVRLKGTSGFRGAVSGFENAYGPVIPNNAIILKALSVVNKRSDADSKRLRDSGRLLK